MFGLVDRFSGKQGVAPDVLEVVSPELLYRIGFQAFTYSGQCEGFGLGAPGRPNDDFGASKTFRDAYDQGTYVRVRELSGTPSQEELNRPYTYGKAMRGVKLDW